MSHVIDARESALRPLPSWYHLSNSPSLERRRWYPVIRLTAEMFLTAMLLTLSAPIILLSAILIGFTSRGPIFYSQTRLGRTGRQFKILKLRSMYHSCEEQSGPCWSTKSDPRITPIGRFLRRTHIDELPQLWNVLRCEMSLIGPRPERPEFLEKLEIAVPRYRDRLKVRPGVTGLAQVQLPPDSDVIDVRRKQAYDIYYINHMSPLLDLRILISTPLKVLGVPYRYIRVLLAMPSERQVEGVYLSAVAQAHVSVSDVIPQAVPV